MTASIAGSQAALKVLYPDGEVPRSINEQFKLLNRVKKDKGFVGELAIVPIQNANPQGSGPTVAAAQTASIQSNYLRFQLQRVKHYGVARVTGEAAEAGVKTKGALVDLWDNECKGAAITELSCHSIYFYGNGTGLRSIGGTTGRATPTITLPVGTNMNNFELNMLVNAVSGTTLSPTVRSGGTGYARITGIDRVNRTLTTSANWTALITDMVDADNLVMKGDAAVAGTATVITGLDSLVVGGASPGTLWGLNRDVDPTRLAGLAIDYTGWSMEDAILDASAQNAYQGIGFSKVLVANPVEVTAMKRSMGAKLMYTRDGSAGQSATGVHGFEKLVFQGEDGPIEVISDPFCPRNRAYLLRLDDFALFSAGAAPHLQDFDGLKLQRIYNDDVFEARFVSYANVRLTNPGPQVRLLNFGL